MDVADKIYGFQKILAKVDVSITDNLVKYRQQIHYYEH